MVLSPLALMFFENPLAIIEAVLLIFLWLQNLKIWLSYGLFSKMH